ncbi:MAG: hypothetical protein R2851_26520 [Caldilineaceae bacterium]
MTRQTVDLIVHSAGQLVTCADTGAAKRGAAMRDLGIIADGAVAVDDGLIVAVGASPDVRARFAARRQIDAGGRAVIPGLVDPHTHVVFGGDRVHEFELRIQGASYMEIMAGGGGILSTMRATRSPPRTR